jgi:hypothetical protein
VVAIYPRPDAIKVVAVGSGTFEGAREVRTDYLERHLEDFVVMTGDE